MGRVEKKASRHEASRHQGEEPERIASSRVPVPSPAALPKWKRNLPNALTLARVGLAVVFFGVLGWFDWRGSPVQTGGVDWRLIGAAALFVAAAVTDALDGYLARKWGVVSLFGRVMDPFADKVLVIGAFVMLAGSAFQNESVWQPTVIMPGSSPVVRNAIVVYESLSHVAPWMVIVILARELLVTSLRSVFESKGVSFAATMSGKLKMILQCVCVPLVLLLPNVPFSWGRTEGSDWVPMVVRITVWATVIVTAWSGIPYVLRAMRESGKLQGGAA